MVSIFLFEFNSFTLKKEIKKGGIAPLQPAVLAAFRPWGILRGAGRTAAAKIRGLAFIKLIVYWFIGKHFSAPYHCLNR